MTNTALEASPFVFHSAVLANLKRTFLSRGPLAFMWVVCCNAGHRSGPCESIGLLLYVAQASNTHHIAKEMPRGGRERELSHVEHDRKGLGETNSLVKTSSLNNISLSHSTHTD